MVRHKHLGYRGLIFDVDPIFQPLDGMISEDIAHECHQDRPWYHVLIEHADQTAYVVQDNLEFCYDESEFAHPLVGSLFEDTAHGSAGAYRARYSMN